MVGKGKKTDGHKSGTSSKTKSTLTKSTSKSSLETSGSISEEQIQPSPQLQSSKLNQAHRQASCEVDRSLSSLALLKMENECDGVNIHLFMLHLLLYIIRL